MYTYDENDDCYHYDRSWRNNVVISFGTFSSYYTYIYKYNEDDCVHSLKQ